MHYQEALKYKDTSIKGTVVAAQNDEFVQYFTS